MITRPVMLGDVADTCLGKMLDQRKNKGEFQPYLANINVRWGGFDLENLPQMRFAENEEERYGLRYGDILVCEGGEPGRCAIWKEELPNMKFQKALHRVRVHEDEVDCYWLFYRFLLARARGEFDQYFSGTTTIKHMPGDKLVKIRLDLPELSTQKRIGEILSAYDALIETNQRKIKLLEEAAQRLYKEWFVDLRYPGHENVPVVDGIPKGWEKQKLVQQSSVIRRGISPAYNEDGKYTVISQKCIRTAIMNIAESRRQEKDYPSELNLQDGDTVICSTGTGTLGRVGQVFGEYPNTTFDSHVTLVRAKQCPHYHYYTIKSKEEYLMGMGRGSTNQQELYRNVIEDLDVFIPSSAVLYRAEQQLESLHKRITILKDENERLAEARDRLLPKLMSGEIAV